MYDEIIKCKYLIKIKYCNCICTYVIQNHNHMNTNVLMYAHLQ